MRHGVLCNTKQTITFSDNRRKYEDVRLVLSGVIFNDKIIEKSLLAPYDSVVIAGCETTFTNNVLV